MESQAYERLYTINFHNSETSAVPLYLSEVITTMTSTSTSPGNRYSYHDNAHLSDPAPLRSPVRRLMIVSGHHWGHRDGLGLLGPQGDKWYHKCQVEDPGGGALTLVLGTHCKTDSRSCGCRLKKRGPVTDPRTLRRGAVRGAFPVGAVVVSLASPRKASWISYK